MVVAQREKVNSSTLKMRATRLVREEIAYVYSSEFEELSNEVLHRDAPQNVHDDASNVRLDSSDSSMAALLQGALLTAEGERWLFMKMNFLKHQANCLRSQLNPNRPKRSLVDQIQDYLQQAEHARTAIIEANTRLVASIAHKFTNSRLEHEELISEGNMILVNAVDKFDYSRGFRFSTYATHSVQRHFYRLMQRRKRRKDRETMTPADILSDLIIDRPQDQPLDDKVAAALISRFDECLDEREKIIIRQRFGLNADQTSETLNVVADKVGLSKERVRQLQLRAIEKLQDLAIRLNLRLEPSF